jgi:DNA mismatch repair protein MutS2
VVESINGDIFTVIVGSLRFRARRDELALLEAAKADQHKGVASLGAGVSARINVDQDFSPELNVIGARVDEATDRVDKFLDNAYLAGAETVRVVHGFGKGALRRAIGELLNGHPHVRSFHPAPSNLGGNGATVVELEK